MKKISLAQFFIKIQDVSSKEFFVYLSIDFSFLINGLLLICMGFLPTLINEGTENVARVYIGGTLVACWFVLLPNISREAKDRIAEHMAYSVVSLVVGAIIVLYWFKNWDNTQFVWWDIVVVVISLPVCAYIIYLLVNFVKVMFIVVRKISSKVLPNIKNKDNGLMFTIEAATSVLVALSSLVAAFWGVITAIKTIL